MTEWNDLIVLSILPGRKLLNGWYYMHLFLIYLI